MRRVRSKTIWATVTSSAANRFPIYFLAGASQIDAFGAGLHAHHNIMLV